MKQKERREDLHFLEKLKFQKYFHWYVCLGKDKLIWAWGRGEGQQSVSKDQISVPQIPDLLCALWVSDSSFYLLCSTYIKRNCRSYLIQHKMLVHARKKITAMTIMAQAKTLLSYKNTKFAFSHSCHSLSWWNFKSYATWNILPWNFIY